MVSILQRRGNGMTSEKYASVLIDMIVNDIKSQTGQTVSKDY